MIQENLNCKCRSRKETPMIRRQPSLKPEFHTHVICFNCGAEIWI